MPTYEIPLTPQAQQFQVVLANVTYQCLLVWNIFSQAWVLDLLDENNVPVIRGIPLVANTDLLEPYPYLNIGGKLVAQTDGAPNANPTYENLGQLGRLYFIIS